MGPDSLASNFEITVKNKKTGEIVTLGEFQFVTVKKESSESMQPENFQSKLVFGEEKGRIKIQAWSGAKDWGNAL